MRQVELRDQGNYECQITTKPIRTFTVFLKVVGECWGKGEDEGRERTHGGRGRREGEDADRERERERTQGGLGTGGWMKPSRSNEREDEVEAIDDHRACRRVHVVPQGRV